MEGSEELRELVETLSWDGDFLLDRDYRFVTVDKTIVPSSFSMVGRSIWDAYGGEAAFKTQYDTVFATGEPVYFRTYFDGYAVETTAEMYGRFLRARYRILATVDVTTLERLLETMRLVERALSSPFGSPIEQPSWSIGGQADLHVV